MTEKKTRLETQISEDNSQVKITFLPESGASGSMNLSLDQLTIFIVALGTIRGEMMIDKPLPPFEAKSITSILNTLWYVKPEPLSEGTLLAFQHPYFGPVAFSIPRDQCSAMAKEMLNTLEVPVQSAGMPN
jgi:hypothetical protein